MNTTYVPSETISDRLPRIPAWATSAHAEAPEDIAFLSGVALSTLHAVLTDPDVPQALLRDRLALVAATACVSRSGRPERTTDLRDAVHFLRPGDQAGPAGVVFQTWRRAVVRPVSVGNLHIGLPAFAATDIAGWLDVGQGGPTAQACAVFDAVMTANPRAEVAALILADTALAQSLGWPFILPLLGPQLASGDQRKTGAALWLAGSAAVHRGATEAVRLAIDLDRRAVRLRNVAPKLRAKEADSAVDLFLTRDALSPTLALTGLGMSGRAARRLCDRLVALGAIHELTGRDTFRLYGL